MNVVAYCRYSSEAQRDGYSIQAQTRAIDEYCKKNDYTLIHTYIDEAKSGTSDNREMFQQMINDSEKNEFNGVIVHKLDRFARNRYDSAMYKKRLRDNGARVISVTEPLDDSPESIILESVLEGMAEYYSKNLSRETKKGKREAARLGRYTGGGIPLGYVVNDDNKFIIEPEEAQIIRDLFNKIDNGTSLYQTAKYAVEQNYRNKRGNYINIYFLRHMIRNPIYSGTLVYGKKPHTGEGEFSVENACEPIIDPDLFWRQYNLAMNRNTGVKPKKRSESDYLLTGYLICGHCGSYLSGYSKTYKQIDEKGNPLYHYEKYRCPRSVTSKRHFEPGQPTKCEFKMINKESIENFVFKHIDDTFTNDKTTQIIAEKLFKKLEGSLAKTKKEISKNDNKINSLVDKTEKLLKAYIDNEIKKDDFYRQNQDIRKEIGQLDKLNKKLRIKAKGINTGEIKKVIMAMHNQQFRPDTIDGKRILLSSLIESIIITNEKVEFKFTFNLDSSSSLVFNGGVEGVDLTIRTIISNLNLTRNGPTRATIVI